MQARRVRRAFLSSNVAARTMPWAPVRRGGIQRACKVWWVSAAGSPCSDRHRRNRDGGWHNGAAADRAAMVYRVWRQDEAARHPTQQPTAVVNQNQQGDATAPSTEPDHYYSNNMSRPPNPAHTSHSLSHTHTHALHVPAHASPSIVVTRIAHHCWPAQQTRLLLPTLPSPYNARRLLVLFASRPLVQALLLLVCRLSLSSFPSALSP